MAYAQGDIILRDHYNLFATGSTSGTPNNAVANINTLWGTGFSNAGYGQTGSLTAVAAGDTVTATQWSTLISRLNTMRTHQTGIGSGLTSPVTGDIITYLSTLNSSITSAYNDRLAFNNLRGTPSTTNYDATWSTPTPTSFQQIRTVSFSGGDQARYFFNAGGRITLTFSIPSGGSDTTKETAWTNLLGSKLASLHFDQSTSTRTGSGGTLSIDGSSLGYYDLTTTNQTLIRITDTTTAYTGNYVEVLARNNGSSTANGDNGNVLTFTINYVDGASDTFDGAINMSVRAAVTITPPSTAAGLTSSWGTVTPATTLN